MLEIKTISNQNKGDFDTEVNTALREGWELVRRDCLIVGSEHRPVLYAELERIIDDPEDNEEYSPADFAHWVISRDPRNPYKCTQCGYTAKDMWATCPGCSASMRGQTRGEEE